MTRAEELVRMVGRHEDMRATIPGDAASWIAELRVVDALSHMSARELVDMGMSHALALGLRLSELGQGEMVLLTELLQLARRLAGDVGLPAVHGFVPSPGDAARADSIARALGLDGR